MIWLTSDEHYGHAKIIQFCERPFVDVGAMDRVLLSNIRKTVRSGDVVWHLGDFSFLSVIKIRTYLSGMPDVTHNITIGNHDRGPNALHAAGFAAVVEEAVLSLMGERILLRHKPLYGDLPDGIDGIFHGHIHRGRPQDLGRVKESIDIPPWNVNLSVEVTDYRPISYKHALKRLHKQLA